MKHAATEASPAFAFQRMTAFPPALCEITWGDGASLAATPGQIVAIPTDSNTEMAANFLMIPPRCGRTVSRHLVVSAPGRVRAKTRRQFGGSQQGRATPLARWLLLSSSRHAPISQGGSPGIGCSSPASGRPWGDWLTASPRHSHLLTMPIQVPVQRTRGVHTIPGCLDKDVSVPRGACRLLARRGRRWSPMTSTTRFPARFLPSSGVIHGAGRSPPPPVRNRRTLPHWFHREERWLERQSQTREELMALRPRPSKGSAASSEVRCRRTDSPLQRPSSTGSDSERT